MLLLSSYSETFVREQGVNNIFSNHLWITGHPATWTVLFGEFFLLFSVGFSPHLPQLSFSIMLQLWFAVKLQKSLMDNKLHPTFHQHGGE